MVDFERLKTGTVINDRYVVESRIGSGGYSEVVAARDRTTGGDVALKILHAEATSNDPRAVARMRQEAEILRAIEHPNIVRIHTVDSFEGGDFLVMERVEGLGLDEFLNRQGTLATSQLVPMVRQLLDALTAAHDTDILHRDLKPENILVCDDASIKLVDFGVAKANRLLNAEDPDEGITLVKTRSGTFVGTPRYAAPEMVVGDPLSPATDLFCVGLIVYEALVGAPLIEGNSQSELINELVFPRPFELQDVSEPWRRWLTPILEKSPDHRVQTSREAGEQLDEIFSSHDSVGPPPETSQNRDDTADTSQQERYPAFGDSADDSGAKTQAEGPPEFGPAHSAADAATAGLIDPGAEATVERPPPDFDFEQPANNAAFDSAEEQTEGDRQKDGQSSDDNDSVRSDPVSGAPDSSPAKKESNQRSESATSTSTSILLFLIFALLVFIIAGFVLLDWPG